MNKILIPTPVLIPVKSHLKGHTNSSNTSLPVSWRYIQIFIILDLKTLYFVIISFDCHCLTSL